MNEFENKPEGVTMGSVNSTTEIQELRGEVQSLRAVVAFGLVLIFIFSFCVNIFLMRQVSLVGMQAGQAKALVSAWSKDGPGQKTIVDFWNKLTEFSRTHPDFAPIINKYNGFFVNHPGSTAPAAAPVKKK